jgi:hypothetical protein
LGDAVRDLPIRVLRLGGDPVAAGRAHGHEYADEIRGYTNDRVALSAKGAD